jgi:glycosyltransferase involved in cell wall biosynthesis
MIVMNVTVILCTYNRSESLGKTLSSLARSIVPASIEWEILIMDNNSNDQTRAVAEDFCTRFPGRFRYLFEPQQGKSYALNSGIRQARGDVLAFVDDDVTVEPAWLNNLVAPFGDARCVATGGRTLMAEAFTPPRWLALEGPYNLGGILAAQFDLGDKPCRLNLAPFGANMAVRKEMFQKYGLYRLDLGPSPSRDVPRPNEDTEFGRRLLAAGEQVMYEPSAVVYHPVSLDRVKKKYFLAWWFDYGRAITREAGKRPHVCGVPRYFFSIPKGLFFILPRLWRWLLALEPKRRFFMKAMVWCFAGEIIEIYRESKQPVNPTFTPLKQSPAQP